MFKEIEKCPECGKEFVCYYYEQKPGFRLPEDKICPYCDKVIKTSLAYEFTTIKMEE